MFGHVSACFTTEVESGVFDWLRADRTVQSGS